MRPTEDLQFYLDMIGGLTDNDMDRSDIALGMRGEPAPAADPVEPILDPGSLA